MPQLGAPTALVGRIKRERDGRLLGLYRMLLHSPPVAEGRLALFTAIRQRTTLPERCRELVTLRVAAINRANYQFEATSPTLERPE